MILLLSLTACVSSVEPTSTPFLVQRIAVSPELEGLISPWLVEYMEESGHANLKLESFSPQEIFPSLETGRVSLGLVNQEVPDGWFATPLWREAITVVVNPKIRLESLDLNNLADIFSGRVETWESLSESPDSIQLVVPVPGSVIRERFLQIVMGNSSFDPAALVGGTPDAIFELVKSQPGAIGILPKWCVKEGVDVVTIMGTKPQEETLQSGAYPLWVDVVAVSPEEPVGHLRDFLVWLQGTYLPSLKIE